MSIEEVNIGLVTYVSHPALTFGDYGGGGSVAIANFRCIDAFLDEHEDDVDIANITYEHFRRACEDRLWSDDDEVAGVTVIKLRGSWGSRTYWVCKGVYDELDEMIDGLESYPLIDDEEHSQVEIEWEREAFDDYADSDLERTLGEEVEQCYDNLTLDQRFEAYRAAMEEMNEYPVPEYSGSYIPTERIADCYAKHLKEMARASVD